MRILLGLIIACLVAINVATGVFYAQAKKQVKAIQESRMKDQHVQAATAQIATTKQQLALLGNKPEELKKRLPTSESINDFFSYVNGLDSKHGVTHTFTFNSSSTGGSSAANTSGAAQSNSASSQDINLSLTVNGSNLDSVLNFVNDLETGPYIITVKQIIATSVNDPASARATVEFTLYISGGSA